MHDRPPSSRNQLAQVDRFRAAWQVQPKCSEPALSPENWIGGGWSFRSFPEAGRGAEDDEGIAVFGGAEGVHPETGSGRHASGQDLLQGGDQPGDLLQLEEEVRRAAADGETWGSGHWHQRSVVHRGEVPPTFEFRPYVEPAAENQFAKPRDL